MTAGQKSHRMDRRAALSTLLPRGPRQEREAPRVLHTGLAPYTGQWGFQQASHLLRRGMFGPTNAQIKWAVQQGRAATVNKLFEELPMPAPPVNTYYTNDPGVPIGATWIGALYPATALGAEIGYRGRSLASWIIGNMWEEGISARQKLTLFWHNHFPIAEILDPKYRYRYYTLLYSHAWGSFRDLTKAITIDPSMLIYLNGNRNIRTAPNENYARELLELFTIGKGPLVGPGDYTNYTEQDIREIARALTGWRDFGFTTSSVDGSIGANFNVNQHDTGTKTLSNRFNNAVINNLGEQEYAHVVDIIFQQAETARYICRKLYQWFIYYEITEEAEVNVIDPMAQILINNDFEIKPSLKALLSSEHFFDPENYGVMIKNPWDFILSTVKSLQVEYSQPLAQRYDSWYHFSGVASLMEMSYFSIPDVAGWRAYFLAPQYYRNWISATTLPIRMRLTDRLATVGENPFQGNGQLMRINVLSLINTLDNPSDPNAVVEEFSQILHPKPLTTNQKNALKAILLPGLPDFEWTVEYGQYAQNPTNSALASAVETKLRALIKAMLSMPEFYLS
jgi:hypothetical protein